MPENPARRREPVVRLTIDIPPPPGKRNMFFLFASSFSCLKFFWRSCLFGTEIFAFIAVVLLLGSLARGQSNDVSPAKGIQPPAAAVPVPAVPAAAGDENRDFDVLTSGPIHEAFARPVALDPKPGPLVKKQPPQPIEELPPEKKPSGKQVKWIPGYWTWNDERQDFVWASGVWRDLPPGRRWVPGYWAQDEGGHRWISGIWIAATASEIEYLAQPPTTLEEGPNRAAPSKNHFWVPGNWVWNHERYSWRPGFWSVQHAHWVWVPKHYNWTPRGYVWAGGYWDFTMGARGLAFAPLYFHRPIYLDDGYHFSPSICFDSGLFAVHLFSHAHCQQYYFGNYYGGPHAGHGIHPWHIHHRHRAHHDPLYTHQRWHQKHHGGDQHWERSLQGHYRHYRDHVDARPARTLADLKKHVGHGPTGKKHRFTHSLDELSRQSHSHGKSSRQRVANGRAATTRLESVSAARRNEIRGHSDHWQKVRQARITAEKSAKSVRVTGGKGPKTTVRTAQGRGTRAKFRLPDHSTHTTPRDRREPVVGSHNPVRSTRQQATRSTARTQPPARSSRRVTADSPSRVTTPRTRASEHRKSHTRKPTTRTESRTPGTRTPSTKQHSTKRHSVKQHSAKQHSTKRHSTKQHSAKQHSTKRHSTKRHSTHAPAHVHSPTPRASSSRSSRSRPSTPRSSTRRSVTPQPRVSAPSRSKTRSAPSTRHSRGGKSKRKK